MEGPQVTVCKDCSGGRGGAKEVAQRLRTCTEDPGTGSSPCVMASQPSGTPAVEDLMPLSDFQEQLFHPQKIKDRDKF